jgi:hypothetical protein
VNDSILFYISIKPKEKEESNTNHHKQYPHVSVEVISVCIENVERMDNDELDQKVKSFTLFYSTKRNTDVLVMKINCKKVINRSGSKSALLVSSSFFLRDQE